VLGLVSGVALAVTFLACLGAFFASAKEQMTRQAVAGVPVDWQVQLNPGADPDMAERTIKAAVSLPVQYGDSTGFVAWADGAEQITGPGKVLGVPDGYADEFPGQIRYLVGDRDGALLAQQTAANLHATVGTSVSVGRPGLAPVTVTVAGIVELPAADSLFQAVGGAGGTPPAPPDNVLLLPAETWHQLYDPVGTARPDAVRTQYHLRLDTPLPPDPAAAFAQVRAAARNLEAQLAGTGTVGDNLGARLDAARADAVYAQLLFLFLGLPGVVLAALLTAVVAATGRDRRRSELALLRLRGATTGQLVRLAGAEALFVGVAGAVVGLGAASRAGPWLLGHASGHAATWGVAAALAGVLLAAGALGVPAWRDAHAPAVARTGATVGAPGTPWWVRVYLDLALLALAVLVYRRVLTAGHPVVLAPQTVPTVPVDYPRLFAPLLLWIGAALLAWRLSNLLLGRCRPAIALATRPIAGNLSGVVAAAMSRRRGLLNRGLVLTALAVSFAVSTAIFNATYTHQTRVDAQLTNGADVAATTLPQGGLPKGIAQRVRDLPGVAAAETMQHRFAYVGNDLQDLYGIDPTTIGRATAISDAYFAGGNASQTLAALAARPDAVLVCAQTAQDYHLQPGDLLRLRLQGVSDQSYHEVEFYYAGVVREFPTAPTGSFLVANASYIARATGSDRAQTLLVRTTANPETVAAAVLGLLPPGTGAQVTNITTELRTTVSGLTALNLAGLTRLELSFAVLLAIAATGLVLGLGLAERRRSFAILAALGARTRHLAAFIANEALFGTLVGTLLGAVSGAVLARMLITILAGAFDPPPERLSVPFGQLSLVLLAAAGAVAAASTWALRAARRPATDTMRDL
jgi:putative ABC transport system permease protein